MALVTGVQAGQQLRSQASGSGGLGVFDPTPHLAQQVSQIGSPVLVGALLGNPGQFPENMRGNCSRLCWGAVGWLRGLRGFRK
jgi:hypothetical protein